MKERELQQLSLAFCESNTQNLSLKHAQFNTYQEEQANANNDQSIRKRAKYPSRSYRIFEPRSSQEPLPLQAHKESSKIMQ
jgi:hypothetical protein